MIVHIKDYGVEPELDDLEAFTHDGDRPNSTHASPTRRRLSPRILRAVNPLLDADDDFDAFDISELVERRYQ